MDLEWTDEKLKYEWIDRPVNDNTSRESVEDVVAFL